MTVSRMKPKGVGNRMTARQNGKMSALSFPDRDFNTWLCTMSSNCSLHGLGWYGRTSNRIFKAVIVVTFLVIIVVLPVVLVTETVKFFKDDKVNNLIEWTFQPEMEYPNITVCYPRFFDKDLMKANGVSEELANYMLTALDMTVRNHTDFIAAQLGEEYINNMTALEQELDQLLEINNFSSPIDLFYSIAIRCYDFIVFCDDHREFYTEKRMGDIPGCCGSLFNERPFFSVAGTCFSLKRRMVETTPATFSSLIINLDVKANKLPNIKMKWHGTYSMDREGAVWVASDFTDHPGKIIYERRHKMAPASTTTVGFSIAKTDRSRVRRRPCVEKNDTFEELFGIPYSQGNCLFMSKHFVHPNCSIGMYFGLEAPSNSGLRPCLPKEVLTINELNISQSEMQERNGFSYDFCINQCKQTRYHTFVTTGNAGTAPLLDYLHDLYSDNVTLESIENTMLLQFYFETFEYPINEQSQQTFFEYLSQLGGWLGLALGASAFSIIELVAFIFFFVRMALAKIQGQK